MVSGKQVAIGRSGKHADTCSLWYLVNICKLCLHFFVKCAGKEEPLKFKKIDADTYETSYAPTQPGNYTVNLQYGGAHIAKSPFKVFTSLQKLSIAFFPK